MRAPAVTSSLQAATPVVEVSSRCVVYLSSSFISPVSSSLCSLSSVSLMPCREWRRLPWTYKVLDPALQRLCSWLLRLPVAAYTVRALKNLSVKIRDDGFQLLGASRVCQCRCGFRVLYFFNVFVFTLYAAKFSYRLDALPSTQLTVSEKRGTAYRRWGLYQSLKVLCWETFLGRPFGGTNQRWTGVISGNRRVESKTDRAVKWRYFVQWYEVTVVGLKNLVWLGYHTHTHTLRFNGHFSRWTWVRSGGCTLNSPSPFIPGLRLLFGTGLNFPCHY